MVLGLWTRYSSRRRWGKKLSLFRLKYLGLVAAVVGCPDDLLRLQDHHVGDVEEITYLIEQQLFAFGHRDILPHHDHAIGSTTSGWTIVKLGHVFRTQPPVLELPRLHNGFFDIVGPLPWLGLNRVGGGPRQGLPRRGWQILGHGLQVRRSIEAEDKPVAGSVPTVEVFAL